MIHYPSQTHLKLVSLTGPDDQIDPLKLQEIAFDYPWLEWALLYVPHNEGAPRNPTRAWRERYFECVHPASTAVHWCGYGAFEQLLNGSFPEDLKLANRWQLNINPRKRDFEDAQIIEIIESALMYKPDIIIQYHDGSSSAIDSWISSAPRDRVGVLLDSSRGKGLEMNDFTFPYAFTDFYNGRAGGIGPENIQTVLENLDFHAVNPYWIDMESRIRTNNQLDMTKVLSVLKESAKYIR